jgi:hypothetical protein
LTVCVCVCVCPAGVQATLHPRVSITSAARVLTPRTTRLRPPLRHCRCHSQSKCHPQTIAVCQTRADGLGLQVRSVRGVVAVVSAPSLTRQRSKQPVLAALCVCVCVRVCKCWRLPTTHPVDHTRPARRPRSWRATRSHLARTCAACCCSTQTHTGPSATTGCVPVWHECVSRRRCAWSARWTPSGARARQAALPCARHAKQPGAGSHSEAKRPTPAAVAPAHSRAHAGARGRRARRRRQGVRRDGPARAHQAGAAGRVGR